MSGGVGAALGEAMATVEPDETEVLAAVQGALDLGIEETGDTEAPSPFSRTLAPKKGKGGRHKGSRNVRTQETMRWILAQHRHPLSVICEAYSMSPAEFAANIGLEMGFDMVDGPKDHEGKPTKKRVARTSYDNETLMEIVKLQMRMAEAALPYLAQKQPQAVQLEGKAGLTVAFAGVNPGGLFSRAVGEAGEFPVIEGQALAVRLPVKSDDESRTDD